MARRYSVGGTFAQPDPYGGSYNFSDPQSLNRYAYVGGDPVNLRDPSGLNLEWQEPWRASQGIGANSFWSPGIHLRTSPYRDVLSRVLVIFDPLTQSPQNSGFLIGQFGFNANETERLRRAYDKITSDKCREFFDATLAALRKKGEIHSSFGDTPTTLAQTLSVTTINKYSSSLTAKDVGVTQAAWTDVRDKFDNYQKQGIGLGVTISDGRVFLPNNAFYQAGAISQLFYKNADLAGIITHELFHRTGLNEDQLKGLRDEIQRNCGTPSFALGN